ncbi:tigger transposable element-derived protein 6-like [Harmonia axyridis]|uniref:tigger transposable element-derived protein 6-like n=1 Tax=Harmonia axyridis TaxID=115357 RepID=UPI001E278708|nr:tigger transposable element-derived protein 6-like [Harmonia axyridis]
MSTKRRVLTLEEKINVVNIYNEQKLSVRELSKRCNIGKTAAAEIVKKRSELLDQWRSNDSKSKRRNFLKPTGSTIDKCCFEWFIKARNKGIPLSGPIIQSKAKEIANNLAYKDFSASSGWLEKFRRRHNIAFKAISGEASSVNPIDVEMFLSKLPMLLKDYSPRNIFNADETGIFFRALPNKTLTLKHEKCTGGKLSKERLTILHCVNLAGEKEKLLVIGKTKKPRAFKNINVSDLPVFWRSNKKAWMTCTIMEEWLKNFDRRMGMERRKILLFLDNASSHPKDIRLTNIQIIFLPPNCTSVVQPLDQGIIRNFKTFYRALVVKKLLSEIESVSKAEVLTKNINVLDAIYYIKTAWQRVTEETVRNCFHRAGFRQESVEQTTENDIFSAEDDIPLSVLQDIWRNARTMGYRDNQVEDFINIDTDLMIEEIDENVSIYNAGEADQSSGESDEDPVENEGIPKNYSQANGILKTLKGFAKNKGDSKAVEMLSELELHFQNQVSRTNTRQTSLLDFFSTT